MNLTNRVLRSVLALAVLLAPGLSPAPDGVSADSGQGANHSFAGVTEYVKPE